MAWTKISGTSFKQDIIDKMEGTETLYLAAEPANEYDPNAVMVLEDGNDEQIGYIRKEEAKEISELLLSGKRVRITDYTITGGSEDKNYGVNIFIMKEEEEPESHKLTKLIPDIGVGFVYFDEVNHNYYDENMKPMLSGSVFESSQTPDFNPEFPAKALEKSTGVDADKIKKLWKKNGELSSALGTLIHEANEFWIKKHNIAEKIDTMRENPITATNWMPQLLGNIVDEYWKDKDISNTEAEIFIRYKNFCGYIDQLKWIDDKTAVMRDYKIVKKHGNVKTQNYGSIPKYSLQQNFYREILKKNDIEVKEMFLDTYIDGMWAPVKIEKIELEIFND